MTKPIKTGAWSVTDEGHSSEVEEQVSRYSSEQRELLEQGLHILARIAVHSYFLPEASPAATAPDAPDLVDNERGPCRRDDRTLQIVM